MRPRLRHILVAAATAGFILAGDRSTSATSSPPEVLSGVSEVSPPSAEFVADVGGLGEVVRDISRPGEVATNLVFRNGQWHPITSPVVRKLTSGGGELMQVNFDDAVRTLPPVDPALPQQPTPEQDADARRRVGADGPPKAPSP